MKIAESRVAFTSQYQFEATASRTESFRFWRNSAVSVSESSQGSASDKLQISTPALESLKADQGQNAEIEEGWSVLPEKEWRKLLVLAELLKTLTGKKIKLMIPEQTAATAEGIQLQFKGNSAPAAVDGRTGAGWGLEYQLNESYQETEKVTVNTEGTIITSEGTEINFQLELKLSRGFLSTNQISVKAGDALVDPLVINYDGPAADVTETKFSFDLDSDGQADSISRLAGGSGFLALDRNGDGVVNNGSELFGPATGDGFAELQPYDSDENGWIDANDPVFEGLRIWTKDSDGNDQLFALGEKGIGAIYLGNSDALFSYTGSENQTLGVNRKAGIFVKENGLVGSIQQVDLVI